ncbi:hypothetical protein QBC39DRAFT_339437 [Podospora conica]|nr:hypothetical protein QBC39DRAFT_339437 [Schizothecium conicum]
MLRKPLSPLFDGTVARAFRRLPTTPPKHQLPRGASRKSSTKAPSSLTSLLWSQRAATIKEISVPRGGSAFRASRFPLRRPFHTTRARRAAAAQPTSLGARLKKLSREYGWTAVGVYMTLSVLDFPFCFLLVRTVGTDRIAEIEHIVVSNVQKVIPEQVKEGWAKYRESRGGQVEAGVEAPMPPPTGTTTVAATSEEAKAAGWGVEEADKRTAKEGASLATQLALAYAIHKSFIFVRVPLTAAILPKVVRVLRGWGWEIGKRRARRGRA